MRANSHFRSSKSAGLGLVTSGDTVAVGSGWQAGTGVFVTHSISTSLRADGTIRTHAGKAFGGSIAGSDPAGPGVDAFFAHPFTAEEVSMQKLFDSLREGGLTPHPWGEENDGQVLSWINSRALSTNTVRSRVFGVDRAQFGFPGPRMTLGDASEDYGTFQDVLVDLADLGGGMFREGVTSDLIWHHIFPYEQNSGGTFDKPGEIPKPADILLNLQDGDYYALSRFMLTVLVAIRHRVQLYPSVFARGGGEGLNSDPNPEGNVIRDPTTGETAPGGVTWQDTIDGKPPHQASVLIPSVWGWNAWYHRVTLDTPHLGEPFTTSTTYQQFALNVYNAEPDDPDTPLSSRYYEGAVPIRKSLALAAFGQGIGEALAKLELILTHYHDLTLSDYIPHLELGAEMDEQWGQQVELITEAGTDDDAIDPVDADGSPSQEALDSLASSALFRASVREYARFHATLALAIKTAWPGARIKASELSSWATLPQSKCRSLWLGLALAEGLATEATFINQVIRVRRGWSGSTSEAAEDWAAVADWCAYSAPGDGVIAVDARSWVDVVGFHWFHFWAPAGAAGDLGYQNEADLWTHTLEPFKRLVVNRCATAGISVTWGVGNVGFPSGYMLSDSPQGEAHLPVFEFNTQALQAASLVRLLLTFWAYGADHVLWFSHMSVKHKGGGGEFATMGLRNDEATLGEEVEDADTGGWEKASWWAFQRLTWLASRASGVDVLFNSEGLVVIRLSAKSGGFSVPSADGTAGSWAYAYVFWLDGAGQSARGSATLEFELRESIPGGFERAFERVPMVPDTTGAGPQGTPYAVSTTVDWDDADQGNVTRFGHCSQEWTEVGATDMPPTFNSLRVRIPRATLGELGVVAWLTNGSTCTWVA